MIRQHFKWENFCVTKDHLNVELSVAKGAIPPSLKGNYLKIGPAWRTPNEVQHILDGDGYLTHIRFGNGKAWLNGGYVTDTRLAKGPNAFGGPMLSMSPLRNKLNTNIAWWNEKVIAFYEGSVPREIGGGIFGDYKEGIPVKGLGGNSVNAHYKVDNEDRMHILDVKYAFGFGLGTWMKWRVYNKSSGNRHSHEVCAYIPHFVYVHDWCIVGDYYMFIRHPLSLNMKNWKNGIASNLKQKEDEPSMVYLICRHSGHVRKKWYVGGNSLFISHIIDCKENEYGLSCKAIGYPSYESIGAADGFQNKQVSLTMYWNSDNAIRLDKAYPNVMVEFPSVCGSFACFGTKRHPMEGIIRLKDDRVVVHDENKLFGEPIVLDDKYVAFMTMAHDTAPTNTSLWVCDANDLNVVCIIDMPDPYVPIGIHGIWVNT